MSQEIINIGSEPNDGTGEPLRNAFQAVNNNFSEIYSAGPVGSNVVISGNTITVTGTNNNLVLAANGIGNIQANSTVMPSVDAVYDIGSANARFDTIYATYFVGNGSLLTGISGGGGNGTAIINGDTNFSIPEASGNVVATIDGRGNVLVITRQNIFTIANIVPGTSNTYSLGNSTNLWKDLYLSNSTIYLGTATVRANATSFTLTTPTGGTLVLQGNGTVTNYSNANVAAYLPTYTGNITAQRITTTGTISTAGNIVGQYIIGDGGFLSNVTVSGNVAVNQIANGTTVLSIAGTNGNITTTVGGVSNVQVITPGGVNVTGAVSASGNVIGDQFVGNAALLSSVTGANVTGIVAEAAQANLANVASTVSSAAQPNITSVGTLTAVSTDGNISAAGNIQALGNIQAQGQVSATGNIVTDGYFVGNFAGNITANIVAPGANTQVLFNTNGSVDAVGGLTYNKDSNTLAILGTVSAQGNVLGGNIQSLNGISSAGNISATGTVTAGNHFIGNAAGLTNIPGANISGTVATANTVTDAAQPNITSVGTLTSLTTSGNIETPRLIVNNIGSDDSTFVIVDDGLEVNGAIIVDSIAASGNVDAGNLNAVNTISTETVSANVVSANTVVSVLFSGSGAELTNIPSGNISGTVATANTVTDAAQPNITSIGTLTSLTTSGNIETPRLIVNNIGSDDSSFVTVDDGLEVNGTIIAGNITADLDIYTSANLSAGGNVVAVNNVVGSVIQSTGNITAVGNITGDYLIGNYFVGNGSQLTGMYGNTEVAAYLPTYTGNLVSLLGNIITTGDITGGNISSPGWISAVGNITGSHFYGNGRNLTGIISSYSDSNVAAYLPTYTGNLVSLTGDVTTTANVNGGNVISTALVQGATLSATGNVVSGNVNTGIVSATGAVLSATLTTTGNAIVGGNLTVNGDLVYVNVTDLNIEDPIISMGRGANDAPLVSDDGKDRGERLWYYDTAESAAFIGYQNSTGKLIAASNVGITNEIVTVNSYGTFVVGTLESAIVSATGNVIGGNLVTTGIVSSGNVNAINVNADNVTANLFVGNAAGLTNIPGSNIIGTVSTANTVTDAAQPNITSVGTLTSLTVSGNIDTSLLIVNRISSDDSSFVTVDDGLEVNGSLFTDSITSTGNLEISGNLTGVNTLLAATVNAAGNIVSANVYTGYVSATGNIDGLNFNVDNLYSDVISASGNITGGNIQTAGHISAAGNIVSGQIISGTTLNVSGNVTSANVFADYASVTGNIDSGNVNTGIVAAASVTAIGNINGGNVSAASLITAADLLATTTISTYGNVNAGGSLTTQGFITASGNVTSGNIISLGLMSAVGTITSTANVTGGNLVSSAAISAAGNITAVGNVIATNFIGNIVGNVVVPGANTQVTYNQNGTLSASSGLLFDYAGNVLTVGGAITTQNGGNLNVAGRISVTGNIDVGVGNINGSNILGSYINSTGNVDGANINAGSQLSAVGNATVGNLLTGGLISSTGSITSAANITGVYIIGDGSQLTSLTGANIIGSVPSAANAAAVSITGSAADTDFIPVMTSGTTGNLALSVESGGGFTYNPSTNILTVGNITVSTALTATGNITGGNIATGGLITATGNITATANIAGGNISAADQIAATGNITGGNIATGGLITATGNITGGNIAGTTLSLSGNVLSALNMTTDITTTGNITANNMAATTSINIAGTPVATVDDATALAIALG